MNLSFYTAARACTEPFAWAMVAAFLAFPTLSQASTKVILSGTHSRERVQQACDEVGGVQVTGGNGQGYGCYNPNNGVLVACHESGTCTGYLPRGRARSQNLELLSSGVRAAPATDGAGPEKQAVETSADPFSQSGPPGQ